MFRNPHARLLLIVFAIETFGAASVGRLVPYLLEYVIPDMKGLMVPILLVFADELLRIRTTDHTVDDLVQAVRATMAMVRGSYSGQALVR